MNHDSDRIDSLLRGEITPAESDYLYQYLLEAAPVPPPGMAERLAVKIFEQKTSPRQPKRAYLVRFLQSAAALLITLTLATGVVYAIETLLERAIHSDPGLKEIELAGEGTALNLSQTVEGITTELQWGYADGTRISLGYILPRLADNSPLAIGSQTLADSAGHVFTPVVGYSPAPEASLSAAVYSFEIANFNSIPLEFDLTLTLYLQSLSSENGAISTADNLEQYGPFTFTFTLPVAKTQIYEAPRTVRVEGIDITLQKVVIAPSAASVEICYTPPIVDEFWAWNATVQLSTGDQHFTSGGRWIDGCETILFREPMPSDAVNWSVTVERLSGVKWQYTDDELAALQQLVQVHGGEFHDLENGMGEVSLTEEARAALEDLGLEKQIVANWNFSFRLGAK